MKFFPGQAVRIPAWEDDTIYHIYYCDNNIVTLLETGDSFVVPNYFLVSCDPIDILIEEIK